MYTTFNENGILNNYAPETETYYAEYPTQWEQNQYLKQAGFAVLLVSTLILVGFGVS